jgi:uncharacterized damage-inducible protein DinB
MMQRSDELRDLFAFNRWANARVRAEVAKLNEDEYRRDLKSSFPSVSETWLHIMSSEWVWLARWLGTSPSGMPPEWKSYDRQQIIEEWQALEAAQLAYVSKLTDTDLDRKIQYINFAGQHYAQPLWHLMRHMVNHSTYHRGQITTMLRQLGHQPVSTDLVLYFREQSQPAAIPN